MKRSLLNTALMLSTVIAGAQHIAPSTDNYHPTHAVLINPASIADNHTYAEIRIGGLSALGQNNFYYLPNSDPSSEFKDDFFKWKKYQAYAEADIYGPAFTKVHKYFSYGANLRVRNHLMGSQVPSNLAKFIKEGFNYPPQHNIIYDEGNFFFKEMSWGELALNYGQMVIRNGDMIATAGGSLKFLSGLANVGMTAKNLNYEVDSQNIYIPQYTGKLSLTVPGANKGYGAGLDAGFLIKKMLKDGSSIHIPHSVKRKCKISEYKWKLGVSVLDFGYINFKHSTTQYKFDNDSLVFDNYQSANVGGITEINTKMEEVLTSSGANPEIKSKTFSTLPLTLSSQFDYNFENNIFANATLIVGIRQKNFMGGERMSSLTLTPRYEKKWFTFGLPLSLYRIKPPAFGLYMRAGYISLGINNVITPILGKDLYGADVYFSLQIPFYSSGPCKEYLSKKSNYCPKPKLKLPSLKDIFKKKDKYK